MKRDLYQTLGVDKSASPEEIKRVFRQCATNAHPDKQSGDHGRMSELNHAYDVLADPKRRLLYDATGEDQPRPDEEMIRGLITQVFADGLLKDVPHILNHAKELLKQGKSVLEGQIDETAKHRDKLKAKRDKITKKSGENVYLMIVDQQIAKYAQEIAKYAQEIAKIEYDLDICVKAQKELGKYKSSEEVPSYGLSDMRFGNQWGFSSGTI